MQRYQVYEAIIRDGCCLINLHAIASTDRTLAVKGRGDRIVPAPPGHARIPTAYPPNRRRRR